MCRLLGYVTREPAAISQILQETLTAFREVSHLNGDGWGFSWYDENGQVQLVKAPEAAFSSEKFASEADRIHTDTFVGHLRWAMADFNICDVNTHPFIHEKFAFAHNGLIEPNSLLEELITPALRATMQGATDSERYFLALLSAIAQAPTVIEGMQQLLVAIFSRLQVVGANFLFATPDTLYAACAFNPNSARALAEPNYFPLKYRITADSVLIGSTDLGQDESWQTLPNGYLLLVNRGTLEVTIVKLLDQISILQQEQYQSLLQQ